jgi:tripartite-type tricarboxylate transporter receptor subunit TctC
MSIAMPNASPSLFIQFSIVPAARRTDAVRRRKSQLILASWRQEAGACPARRRLCRRAACGILSARAGPPHSDKLRPTALGHFSTGRPITTSTSAPARAAAGWNTSREHIMNHRISLAARSALPALFVGLAASPPAQADDVAEFYKGKDITINVGYGSGGGYDTTTRIFARHFGNHIPGHPGVVVQNMPGAGSMKAANYTFAVAPKDGTTLGVFASSTALEPLFGNKKANYDPRQFEWVGSLHRDIASCAVWKGAGQGIKTLPDLIKAKRTVTFGSTSPTAITSQHPLFLKHMLGANLKVIYGYKGTKEVSLAMQRGEVDGSCGMFESSVRSAYHQHVENGEFKIIVQFGRDRKIPYFGDATQMYTLLKTDEQRKIADVIFRQTELARPLAAPPSAPKDRVAALRKAMLETMKDPALLADSKKLQIEFDPVPGEETAEIFGDFYKTPPALVKKAAEMTQPEKP